MRVLGIMLILLSGCGLPAAIMSIAGGNGMTASYGLYIAVSVLFVYLVPGVLYLLCATYLKQRRHWAVILGLVVTSMSCFFVLMAAAGLLVAVVTMPESPGAPLYVFLGLTVLFLAAFTQLIYHLSKCFQAIRLQPASKDRGLEATVLVQPPTAQVISTNWDPPEEQER
jgi:Ni/Fe-hydrogenase subunit HybB-like protein